MSKVEYTANPSKAWQYNRDLSASEIKGSKLPLFGFHDDPECRSSSARIPTSFNCGNPSHGEYRTVASLHRVTEECHSGARIHVPSISKKDLQNNRELADSNGSLAGATLFGRFRSKLKAKESRIFDYAVAKDNNTQTCDMSRFTLYLDNDGQPAEVVDDFDLQ
ncbi:hypothetical protein I302_101377 [Kwoniella bestiolae CBS 10118]|uniref:Uncharacterized protein n=1 Tax=Kwoniella bestiolae CBS 10118 TaxID=1296100 RepID=A0A1B9GC18_9TREE|nr:hypothetical protein I302_00060 [Kwoniella bestiolae CBS 10118]OCF28572.1 hypothetical protein I302_00060 [Kwoniella bestiolae CBS 10118]